MINNGIYFNQTISSSDYTISGYGSIFTSLYPYNVGKKGVSYRKLFSKIPNYIIHLKNSGYSTYATMDSNFLKLGFSEYFENNDLGYDRTTTGLFEGLEQWNHSDKWKKYCQIYSSQNEVNSVLEDSVNF
jgi:hypothetical protein